MAHTIGENCIGCASCARACPVHAIEGAPKSRHVINARRCVDCGVCGMSCPVGAVKNAAGEVCRRVPPKERPAPGHRPGAVQRLPAVRIFLRGRRPLPSRNPAFPGMWRRAASSGIPKNAWAAALRGRVPAARHKNGGKGMKKRRPEDMPLPVYARVDLTRGEVSRFPISRDYYAKYVGGKCMAARLLLDLTPAGAGRALARGGHHHKHGAAQRHGRALVEPLQPQLQERHDGRGIASSELRRAVRRHAQKGGLRRAHNNWPRAGAERH